MNSRKPNIKDVQKRIANISIGASTLRGQGGPGVVKTAREFLKQLDLARLSKMTPSQFNTWLDRETRRLSKRFEGEAKNNWGAARKAINVFLENAFYNRFLANEYALEKLEDILEIPLDSNVVGRLCGRLKKFKKFKGFKIKTLKPDDSKELQELAKNIAKNKHTSRIYLDLRYWRAYKKGINPN